MLKLSILFKSKLPYLMLLIAGGISVFAFAPFNHGLCIVISMLLLLWYSNNETIKNGFYGALFYGIGFFASQLYWMFYSLYYVINIGFFSAALGSFGFIMILAVFSALTILLYKKLITKSDEFNCIFLFPACWVICEWLRGWIFTGFPWSDIAYTQVNNYLMQGLFPVLGSYAVSWVSLSVIGFLYVVFINHKILSTVKPQITKEQRLSVAYLVILALIAYFLHGKVYTQTYGKPIKIALVQVDVNGAEKWDNQKFLHHLDRYASLISKSKADIIFLSETAIAMYESYLPVHYADDITKIAQMNHADLVIGIPRLINDHGDYVNSATVFTQPNHPYYAKSHLVPFGEYIPFKEMWGSFYLFAGIPMVGFSPGSANQSPLVIANQKVAFNICYENGFGSELITAAREATLMANLSDMVWYGKSIAKDQHLQLSQARAMENQRYFIQDTNTGLTAIINPFGVIQSQLADFKEDVLTDYVEGKIGITPYQRYGNYPIISFCLLIIFGVLILRLIKNKK